MSYVADDPTGERAYEIYLDYENLPKTLTCHAVEEALGVTLSVPCMSADKPFLLAAAESDGRPAMVKVLTTQKKVAELCMERDVLRILDFSGTQPGLVQARCVEVHVSSTEIEVQQGSNVIPKKEGKKSSISDHKLVYAILMPRYVTNIVANFPKSRVDVLKVQFRKLLGALNYIHDNGIVHLDIKAHNIFVNGNGEWVLGDFGSCKYIGDKVVSTTPIYYFKQIRGKKAVPAYDYYMLLVVLLIELLPDKRNIQEALMESRNGVTQISYQKVNAMSSDCEEKFPQLKEVIQILKQNSITDEDEDSVALDRYLTAHKFMENGEYTYKSKATNYIV